MESALVDGELHIDPDTGLEVVRYPSLAALAERYKVSHTSVWAYAKKHRCLERRKEAKANGAAKPPAPSPVASASALDVRAVVDEYLLRFQERLRLGQVKTDSAADFDRLARLRELVTGNADSRQEIKGGITLEAIQARHRAFRDRMERMTPELAGISNELSGASAAPLLGQRPEHTWSGAPPAPPVTAASHDDSRASAVESGTVMCDVHTASPVAEVAAPRVEDVNHCRSNGVRIAQEAYVPEREAEHAALEPRSVRHLDHGEHGAHVAHAECATVLDVPNASSLVGIEEHASDAHALSPLGSVMQHASSLPGSANAAHDARTSSSASSVHAHAWSPSGSAKPARNAHVSSSASSVTSHALSPLGSAAAASDTWTSSPPGSYQAHENDETDDARPLRATSSAPAAGGSARRAGDVQAHDTRELAHATWVCELAQEVRYAVG